MKSLKYSQIYLVIFFVLICANAPLMGQFGLNPSFVREAFRSVKNIERYQVEKADVFKTYLTFHPVSISNDTVSLYVVSTIFSKEEGRIIELGEIVEISPRFLPDEPLQLIVLPLDVWLNVSRRNKYFVGSNMEPSDEEISIWKSCGYEVKEGAEIRLSSQYR